MDFPGGLLAELEHALQQAGVVGVELAALPALLHQHAQLLGRVDRLELGTGALQPQQPHHPVGAPVEEVGERPRYPREKDEGGGDPAARALGMGDGPGLGRLLAEQT